MPLLDLSETVYLELALDVQYHAEWLPVPFSGSPMGAREEPEIFIDAVRVRGVDISDALTEDEWMDVKRQVESQVEIRRAG